MVPSNLLAGRVDDQRGSKAVIFYFFATFTSMLIYFRVMETAKTPA